jgi:hypothetical protein
MAGRSILGVPGFARDASWTAINNGSAFIHSFVTVADSSVLLLTHARATQ